MLQMLLRLSRIAGPLLGDSQQRLDSRKAGLQFERGAQMRNRFRVIPLKPSSTPRFACAIDVLRIERDNFAQHRNRKFRLLVLEILLQLPFQGPDLLLNVLGILRQDQPRQQK